jgi:hypothetical protein
MNITHKRILTASIFGILIGLVPTRSVVTTQAFSTDLFIRSVYNNASSDNMLEIFNGTGASVNLNNYYVSAFHNGTSTPTATHRLSNIDLPNGSAFLLGKDSSTGPYTATERAYVNAFPLKLLLPNGVGFQNAQLGNDAFALRKNSSSGTIIDVFGMIGYGPNVRVGWRQNNTEITYGYVDPSYTLSTERPAPTNYLSSLIRRPDVINPQVSSLTYNGETRAQSFKPSEWGVYNVGVFAGNVYRFNLFDNVTDVIALINNLPTPITQNDAAAVAAARAAYDALSSSQKSLVTNYADLQADEAVIAGFAKIIEVINLINAIPDPLTLAGESFVTTAKTAFDALTTEEQAQVTNAQELTDAIALINNLKAVQKVITDINNLPTVITLGQADAIASIRAEYEALSEVQQGLISNYATFVTKENEYFRLKGINDVEALIDLIPIPVTLENGVVIANARTAYNLLTNPDQAEVDNYTLLTNAENHYLDLQAAKVVIDQIDDIEDPITLASRQEVAAARAALGLLTTTQQGLVTNQQRLIDMEAIIADILDEVDDVITLIDGLPDPIAITNLAQLQTAEAAFNALSDEQEAEVTNEPDLVKAREQMDAILAKIQEVIAKINLIVDPVTLAQTATIEAARAAFNALTVDEKALVTNSPKLLLAEEVIIDLNTPRYVVSYVVFNQIFSEVVKSGTTVRNIPTSLTRLGYTFGGWVLEGTTTLLDLSTYIVTSGQRLVAVFNIDPTSNQSELLIEIEGLNNIDVETLFPNRDVSLQLNIDLLPVAQVPVIDKDEIIDLVSTQNTFTMDNIFFLDLSIVVTYVDNGISVEETLPEISEPVEITVSIPQLFRAFASYQVVRVHEGEPTFLNTVYDASTNSVTFSTDKFSTYGVLYSNAITDALMARIDAIPVPPTLADLASIQAIRADFNNLTAAQKLMITNVQLLINAENALQGLQAEIDAVIALINLIEDPVRIADQAAIDNARDAYDALDPLQQALVSNYQDLVDAEEALADLYAGIQDIIARIDGLPDPLRIADLATVDAIRVSFNALTLEQKGLVTNIAELTAAENTIDALIDEVNRVKALIAALGDPILLADETDIEDAREAFDALTTEQQGLIDNVDVLTSAEDDYQTLLDEIDVVNGLILALTTPTTLASEDAILAAREAYDALTVEQQGRILNVSKITTAEADYQILVDEVEAVKALIIDLETPVMIAHEDDIEAARAAFDALTLEQQGYVTNVSTLTNAETDLATLYAEIDAVNAMIEALNDPITLEDDLAVSEAKEAYDDLTEEQQGYIVDFPVLQASINTIGVLKADINAVIALIIDLDTPTAISQEAAIEAAREAYDELTTYEKTFVTNYQDLVDAETDLATLYEEIDAVNQMMIDLNNPITIADETAILEARDAYDALTAEQKTFVLNLNDLVMAEADLAMIKAKINSVIQLIIDLNDPIRIADEEDIEAARAAYDALSVLERTYVTNFNDLVEAETDLARLYAEIAAVNALILELSDPIDLDDQDDLEATREAYDALTLEQQGYVIGFPSFVEAEEDFQTLLDEIDAVEAMIAALPIPVTSNNSDAVQAARDAFDDLNPLQQARVTNSIVLANAEARLLDLEVADTVSDEVMDLPFEDDVTLDHQAAIEAAREAYEALTPNQKSMVSAETLQHLVNAENALRRLLNPGFDFFSLLPYHLASGLIIAILFFIKSKKEGA